MSQFAFSKEYDPFRSETFRQWIQELLTAYASTPWSPSNTTALTSSPWSVVRPPHSPQLSTSTGQNSTIYPDVLLGATDKRHVSDTVSHPVPAHAKEGMAKIPPITPYAYVVNQNMGSSHGVYPAPTAFSLFAWCPVEIQPDGECCVAGLYKESPTEPLIYIKSGVVTSVTENGSVVSTADGRTYRLLNGISWWIHSSNLSSQSDNLVLPERIQSAFSNGFPATRWRAWTQGLYYYISGDEKKQAVIQPDGSHSNQPSMKIGIKKPSTPYNRVLPSRQQVIDLDLLPDVTGSESTDQDLSDSFENPTSPEASILSTSSFDDSEVPTPSRRRKHVSKSPRVQLKADKHVVSKPSTRKPKLQSTSRLTHISEKIRKKCSTDSHRIHSNRNSIVTGHSKRHSLPKNVPDKYKLYTASGSILDTRDMEQTRSGRWVLPNLDRRYNQSLVIRKNRAPEVMHET